MTQDASTHSNADYSGQWAAEQKPVMGKDRNSGGDIEQQDPASKEWKNPRVRINFFNRPDAYDYHGRFKRDIGPDLAALVGDLVEDDDYVMAPDERRNAFRFKIDGMLYEDGQQQGTSLGFLRAISSDGKDAAGVVVYPDDEFDVGVQHDGKYTMEPDNSDPRGPSYKIGFIPVRKHPVADAIRERRDSE